MYWFQLSGKKLRKILNTYSMMWGVRLIMVSHSDFGSLKFFSFSFILFPYSTNTYVCPTSSVWLDLIMLG
jgi:hypothetical protein